MAGQLWCDMKAIDAFNLHPGRVLLGRYEVMAQLGSGWEGEVYRVRERGTDIERAAKLFYPHRNPNGRVSRRYAGKLHKLRDCPILVQYLTYGETRIRNTGITVLISEFVDGPLLSEFIQRQRGKVLSQFQAVHLLHALATGIEDIHLHGEYHGDIHADNIIVRHFGLSFDLKLFDFYHAGRTTRDNLNTDIVDIIRIFYDSLGGKKRYASLGGNVKAIINGMKRSLIARKFPHVSDLKCYLENASWE
jgi:serine/threonine protein kinase